LQTTPANSINSSHIQNGTILGEDIGAYTITDGNILFNSIGNDKLNDLTIQDNKIANTTISLGKLTASAIASLQTTPANSINSSHIQDGTITGGDIAATTITATNIANETITKFQIAPNAITNDKIASSAVLAIHIGNGVVNSSHIQTGTILGEDISAGTINLSNLSASAIASLQSVTIPANSINSSHIINGTILTEDISNNAITNTKIADFSISNSKLQDDSIDSRKIIAGGILGTDIATNQIGVSHLTGTAYLDLITTQAPDSINSSHIVNRTITGTDIALQTIKGENIEPETITSYNLSISLNNQITALQTAVNDLALRIGQLELTAITRSVDVVSGVANSITIPIDLLNNDSVEISITFRFYGTYNISSRLYAEYRTGGTNNILQQFAGTVINVVTQGGTQNEVYTSGSNVDWRAMLMYNMNTDNFYGNTNSLVFKLIRPVNNLADPKEWSYVGESTWSSSTGRSRGELNGNYYYRPDSISFWTNANYTFQARYSIVNDKRT
jgi:hypothetical protein